MNSVVLHAFGLKFAWYGAFLHDLITPMGCGPNHNTAMKWRAELDLRLNGKRTYRFRLFPHPNDWRDDNVPAWAMAIQRPPVVHCAGQSAAPPTLKPLHLKGSGIVPTVVSRDEHLRIRFYEAHGRETTVEKLVYDEYDRVVSIEMLYLSKRAPGTNVNQLFYECVPPVKRDAKDLSSAKTFRNSFI